MKIQKTRTGALLSGLAQLLFGLALLLAGPATQAGTITYFHNDLAGSPVAATNEQGQVIWRENYRPYGERLVNSPAASGNSVWFTSRRQDAESGLVYMGARYYDPVAGRFVSTDPAGFDEGNVHSFNRYAYANNNPYRYVDPDGQAAEDLFPAGAPIVAFGKFVGGFSAFAQGAATGNEALRMAGSSGMVENWSGVVEATIAIGSLGRGSARASGAANGWVEQSALTSNAARREVMREAGIPTSQQPISQSRNGSGREYSYDIAAPGGGSQRMSVQQQTMDRNHAGQPHWEAGRVKTDPLTGDVRVNSHGRPALTNDKAKVNY